MKFSIKDTSRALKLASVPLVLASLAACATPFKADVSRFQSQMPAPQGESFAVVADDPALAGGLEFAQYADFVEAQMERLGYAEAASPESATLLVRLDYGVDKGRERVRTTNTGFYDPFWDPWYRYRSPFYHSRYYSRFRPSGYWGYGFYDPWFGGPEVRSYTVYTSGVDMKIDRASTGERLFEGKAEAVSTSNRLQYLVPNLVEAMFTDFPGNSGETVRITIKPEKENTVRRIN
ncbi:DUF4136 domain-containing protein [Altererythrobacter arenosus]|uniref:DUF4136 domain-containing protein n=1 Tax=Altererythrobacter arenosus TaxID=3032592 RepID=A0ABY8FM11_9SPHN|nr:DUF4136 domain-containing protein [Altererythrobacter sp. CAU 1644]WFL76043.1 DUF4136 domain-containing protein [Altererythrobacter sp. CAU 1644]